MKRRPFLAVTAFFAELKRRKVYPMIVAYAVIAWVVLQVAEVTLEPLGFSQTAMTLLILAAIMGFIMVFALAWYFEITESGIERDTRSADESMPMGRQPSIAVLPFIDMSPNHDQAYFCEGVAEEILNALTKVPGLNVAARSSSFQFRGDSGDVRKIGRELGVGAILEGSVRKSEERLRVAAQLVKVADGYHLWAQTYDESPKDIFTIQDEIATGIAYSLLDSLTPTEKQALKTTSSKHYTAYDFYLRGRKFFKRFNKLDMEFARQMFQHAIQIDPEFALAWAGYADCCSFLIMYADPNPHYLAEASKASKKALQLNPELAEAHASRGLAYGVSEKFALAEEEFNKALKIKPNLFEAYYYFGRTQFHQGDLSKAAGLFKKAAEVDPSDYQSRLLRIQILRGMGDLEQARAEASAAIPLIEQHLEWNPDDTRALHLGAGSLIVLGEIEKAKRWMQRAVSIDRHDSVLLYNVACNYATLGESEAALEYLQAAIDNGMVSASWIRNDADIEPIRSDPRYAAMLKELESRDTVEQPATDESRVSTQH